MVCCTNLMSSLALKFYSNYDYPLRFSGSGGSQQSPSSLTNTSSYTPHHHFPSFTRHPTVCHSKVSTKLSPYRSNIPLKNKTEKFCFKCLSDKKGLIFMMFLLEMFKLHTFIRFPGQYIIIIFPFKLLFGSYSI